MKSTLKIHELEIIIDGVDEQWLIQNNKHIIQAIHKAFDPYDMHQFPDNIINEIVIDLPKTNSFNDFLVALTKQIQNQVLQKYALSSKQINEIKNKDFIPLKWKTIDDLLLKLKENSNIHSSQYNDNFSELLQIISNNNSVIWDILYKIGISKSIIDSFIKWSKAEQINPKQILQWIGYYFELSKKNNNVKQDNVFLNVILETQYKGNKSKIAFNKINSEFVEILLKTTKPINKELVEYIGNIKEVNSIFTNYFSDFNVIKNLIDIQFIEKIIQLNLSSQSQNYNNKKREIILYYNLILIANTIGKSKYDQLFNSINIAYLNADNGQLNYLNILKIFNENFSSTQYKKIKDLIELLFQETYLINYNIDFNKNINQIKIKVESFLSENFESQKTDKSNSNTESITLKNDHIVQHIIDVDFFRQWPDEIKHLKSKLKIYINSFLETGNYLPISFAPESENLRIIMTEINRILLEIRLKSKPQSPELINNLLAHSSTLNYLFFNLSNLLFKEITLDKESINVTDIKDNRKTKDIKINKVLTNKNLIAIWSSFISEFDFYDSNNIYFNQLKQKIKTENPESIYTYLTNTTSSKFAQTVFEILITLQKNQTKRTQPFILSYLLQFIEIQIQSKNTATTNFESYIENIKKSEEYQESKTQQAKEKIINETISTIEEIKDLIQPENITEFFTEEELKLWNGLINIIEEKSINIIKLTQQIKLFEDTFNILNEFWFENVDLTVELNLAKKFNHLFVDLESIFSSNNSLLEINQYPKQIIQSFEQIIQALKLDPIFLFELFVFKQNKLNIEKKSNSIFNEFGLSSDDQNPLNKPDIKIYLNQLLNNQINNYDRDAISIEDKNLIQQEFEYFKSQIETEINLGVELFFENFKNDPLIQKIFEEINTLESLKEQLNSPIVNEKIQWYLSLALLEIFKNYFNTAYRKYQFINAEDYLAIFLGEEKNENAFLRNIEFAEEVIKKQEDFISNLIGNQYKQIKLSPNSFNDNKSTLTEREVMDSWMIDMIPQGIPIDDNVNRLLQQLIVNLAIQNQELKRNNELERDRTLEQKIDLEKNQELERINKLERDKTLEQKIELERNQKLDRINELERDRTIELETELERNQDLERNQESERNKELERNQELENNNELGRDDKLEINEISTPENKSTLVKYIQLENANKENLDTLDYLILSLSEVFSIIYPKWISIINSLNVSETETNKNIIQNSNINWMEQLVSSPILLQLTQKQSLLFRNYLNEILKIQSETYTLKEHVIFKNAFTMLLHFIEQTAEIKHILVSNQIENIQKKATSIITNLKSTLQFQETFLTQILISKYANYKEFEIANESKIIIQNIFKEKAESNEESINKTWVPKNIWFQTEQKIPFQSIFDNREFWKVLFSENNNEIYIENTENNIQPIWDKSENYKILNKHPQSKKWMVQLSKNKGEGFMELASSLSFNTIIEAQTEKYKSAAVFEINIENLLTELKTLIPNIGILEFYQFTKFQLIQIQSPPTKLQLAQIFYLSYISLPINKTFVEISKFTQLITQTLSLNGNESSLLNKLINEKLPNQNDVIPKKDELVSVDFSNNQTFTDSHIKEISLHVIKYPFISESEIIEQLNLLISSKSKLKDTAGILNKISKQIWEDINNLGSSIFSNKRFYHFLNKTINNWLTNKQIHWTINRAFQNIEQWLTFSKTALLKADISEIQQLHPSWGIYDEKYKSEVNTYINSPELFFLIETNTKDKSVEFDTNTVKTDSIQRKEYPLKSSLGNNDVSLKLPIQTIINDSDLLGQSNVQAKPLSENAIPKNEVIIAEFKEWQSSLNEKLSITNKKLIENQQNNEEYKLELPYKPKDPSILNWDAISNSNEIEKALLSILLIEGIEINQSIIPNNDIISTNQFLSSKAIFRILGHSSVPLQFIGLLYEQFFGYSLGLVEENWTNFTSPKSSKSLSLKLKNLRKDSQSPSETKNETGTKIETQNWFEDILNLSNLENQKILDSKNFNLIIKEIQQKIRTKLNKTKFANAPESLQVEWINHLIFFKLIKFENDNNEIGGFFSILSSEPSQIDNWINRISESIIFDIDVEFDFWITNISKFANYFQESNIITLFQISESLKLINTEIKLPIEDIFEATLKNVEHRPFQEAILNVFLPNLIPIFYENHLTKTNLFRELNLISLILNERNYIGQVQSQSSEKLADQLNLDNIFIPYKNLETAEIEPEILREISFIIGKNLDETSRWILHELSHSDPKKLNVFKQKIQDSFENKTKINNYYNSIINNPKLSQSIQELISPIIINIQDKKKTDSKIKQEIDNGTRFITTLCGLMMLSPFLATLFRRMGLLEKNSFISEAEQLKAYKVLMTIPKIDEEKEYEYQDLIPRIITGIAPEDTIHYVPELTEAELTEIRNFLGAVISQWPVMANATVRGFIESFLIRDGKVWKDGTIWKIEVNGHGADMIMQTLTWGFSTMKFPWTPYLIETNWQPA